MFIIIIIASLIVTTFPISINFIIIIVVVMFNVLSQSWDFGISIFAVRADINQMLKVSRQYHFLGT